MNTAAENEPPDVLLAAAYALDGPEANRAHYADWAATYESGFVVESGYVYHEQVAALLVERNTPPLGDADPVLDVGCGTGIVGAALRRRGILTVDGVDISPEMLDQARSKQLDGEPVYRTLIEADLTRRLPIESGRYAGVVSVGTFTHGHVGPEALVELVRITRPGGRAVIGVNAAHFESQGFAATLDELGAAGRITIPELVVVPIYESTDMNNPSEFAHVVLFEVVGRVDGPTG